MQHLCYWWVKLSVVVAVVAVVAVAVTGQSSEVLRMTQTSRLLLLLPLYHSSLD